MATNIIYLLNKIVYMLSLYWKLDLHAFSVHDMQYAHFYLSLCVLAYEELLIMYAEYEFCVNTRKTSIGT